MTPSVQAAALILALVVAASAGPWMLRHAAPALMRTPRLAVGLLLGSIVAWILALLAVGPMLAWIVTGPAVLSGGSAQVCQRCLAAASPSTAPLFETIVPIVALLALPAVVAAFLASSTMAEALRRRRATLRTARRLRARSTFRVLYGHHVLVTDDPHPFALTLPRRHGGIVISTGALDLLADDETAAVLAHEHAHLHQRHHLITAVVTSLTRRLRWVPLLAAAADALGHYLEIAADDAARHRLGTPALASALLTLAQDSHPAHQQEALDGALHAHGPDRVRHLTQPRSGTAGVIYTTATAACLIALAFLSFTVHVPYALAALTGCV
ncbi:MAG: M56 family metallopeptidase [Nocardioides sp.]|uniref:M56 family metallopeptidase n=1 Tax=Nocardioides sp. TaxID=35761 RepID=UPI003D6BD475